MFHEVDILKECEGNPYILQMICFFESDNDFRLVFEKAEGGALLDHIQERKTFTEREASHVTRDMARALSFLHEKGIAHRDLKPSNILCARKGQASPAKLCDFDLGTRTEGRSTPPIMTPVGTPEFMSPEVAEAYAAGEERTYDKRCDIWRYSFMHDGAHVLFVCCVRSRRAGSECRGWVIVKMWSFKGFRGDGTSRSTECRDREIPS